MKLLKKSVSILLSVIMIFSLFTIVPFTASAAISVSYIDENGDTQIADDVTEMTGSTYLSAGWYAVTSDMTIQRRITCEGDVHLILCDGYTLTAPKGITVSKEYSLTIYGQSNSTGALVCTDVDYRYAGIGGGYDSFTSGQITINGGTLTVKGGAQCAGIHGPVTINGGTITAEGGSSGAGIQSPVTINGGTINASAPTWAAAIGGNVQRDGEVTINGGTINAKADIAGTAIGGGNNADGTVTINGGTIYAEADEAGTAIGGGTNYNGTVTINGGVVEAYAKGERASAIGTGGRAGKGTVTINGGVVKAVSEDESSTGIGGNDPDGFVISLDWSNLTSDSITSTKYGGTVTLVKDFTDGETVFETGTVSDNSTIAGKTLKPISLPTYKITWENEDGTTLQTDNVKKGVTPVYSGDTPTKAADGDTVYQFSGWTPEVVAAAEDAVYTAKFTPCTHVDRAEPYINSDGEYILGNVEHYAAPDGKNYAVGADGSVGGELDSVALSYFDFEEIGESYQILHYTGSYDGLDELVIPKSYNGKPITVIGDGVDNASFMAATGEKKQFVLTLNENITEIKRYAFYTMWVTEVKGDTSNLSKIGAFAFSWANSPDDYTLDITLSYDGQIDAGVYIFNNMKVTARMKHATSLGDVYLGAQSLSYIFTDEHPYGDPEWTWADDNSNATAKFTCTDSRCKHEETVDATVTNEEKDGQIIYTATVEINGKTYTDKTDTAYQHIEKVEPYIDGSGEYHLGTIEYYVIDGRNYAINADGSAGGELDSVELSYFDFQEIGGSYQILHYTGSYDGLDELVIPKSYNGKPITVIGDGENDAGFMQATGEKKQFVLTLNENITEIKPYAFYGIYVTNVKGDTSSLRTIGKYAFSWANAPGDYALDITLDYNGRMNTGKELFNNLHVTAHIKHATTFGTSFPLGAQSIDYVFTDDHIYGDPVWTWSEDVPSVTAKFICTDSRCKHEETVDATLFPEYSDGKHYVTATVEFNGETYSNKKEINLRHIERAEPYIDSNGEYQLGTLEHYLFNGKYYTVNDDGSVGSELNSVEISYFEFKLINNDTEYRVNYYTGPTENLSELVIPKTFNGKKITEVGTFDTHIFLTGNTPSFTLVLNENIRTINKYSFWTTQVSKVTGDTSSLNYIGMHAFSWANNSGGNKIEIHLDYAGRITCEYELFNHMHVTVYLKHAATLSKNKTYSEQSLTYIFIDEHRYGDPAWTWADDHSSATAKFTCTDSRCKHEETVDATVTSETEDEIITYTATVEMNGNTYTDTKTVYEDGIGTRLVGRSLSLDGDIAVNFYMELSDSVVEHKDTAYMHFTIPIGGGTTEQNMFVKDARVVKSGGKTYYVFKCRVAAKEMTSEIKAQIIDGDKSGTEYTYSVKEYADYLLAHTDEREDLAKAAPLVKALLNYGAYAQMHFDKNPGALANADLTDEEKALGDVTFDIADPVFSGLPEGTTFAGASLSLKSETTLSLYFKSEEALAFSCDGYNVETVQSGSYQIARIRGIQSKHIGDILTLNVNGGTISYSPLNYCKNILADDTQNEKLHNVVKALYLYWQAADSYFE